MLFLSLFDVLFTRPARVGVWSTGFFFTSIGNFSKLIQVSSTRIGFSTDIIPVSTSLLFSPLSSPPLAFSDNRV